MRKNRVQEICQNFDGNFACVNGQYPSKNFDRLELNRVQSYFLEIWIDLQGFRPIKVEYWNGVSKLHGFISSWNQGTCKLRNGKKRKETERNGKKKNEKKTRRKATKRNEKKRNAKKRKQNSEKRNETKEKEKKRKKRKETKRNEKYGSPR